MLGFPEIPKSVSMLTCELFWGKILYASLGFLAVLPNTKRKACRSEPSTSRNWPRAEKPHQQKKRFEAPAEAVAVCWWHRIVNPQLSKAFEEG